ncbi:MAG: EscU/YscU/HrcU family type III secretion system export apparatus switch protein [Vulcanimicrobiaceae bacterium]|jgi:flagellar biosynthesis protein
MNSHYFDARRNPPQRPAAAALTYDPTKPGAPEITAIGRGLTAEEIVRLAREHDVPVHQDAGLVEALAKLEVGQRLPRELYAIVAEVLAFVYAVDAQASA